MPANHYQYNRPAPVLPSADSLPYPASAVVQCSDCGLRSGCTRPVPAQNIDGHHDVMLVGEAPGCFPSGTYVSTPDGVKDISTFAVGDLVLGASGQPQKVTSVFSRQTDELMFVKIRGQVEVVITPNHPVLVYRPVSCYDGHTREFCFPCSRPRCGKAYFHDYSSQWVTASELHYGDHVIIPDMSLPEPSNAVSPRSAGIVKIPFPQPEQFPKKYKFRNGVRQFRLSKGLAYILGWYMAEGYSNIESGAVSFNLGYDDKGLRGLLSQNVDRVFGIGHKWYIKGKSYRLFVYSRPLAAWFIALFGGNQRIRHVPSYIFQSNVSVIRSFIRGWYSGDGRHERSGKNDGIVTASKEAAYGLHSLLLHAGVCATVCKEKWKIKGKELPEGYFVSFRPDLKWERERNAVSFLGRKLLRVDTVRRERVDCSVYNIGTDDNAYLVPFIVHNSNEDLSGIPFYGMSGQYLNSLLFQAGLNRESVAVSNTVHCRPPNNRTPRPDETRSCSHWLELELDIVQPRIVVALGKPATDWFLPGNNNTMEHLHGKPVEVAGRIILPCYHPAAALRDTAKLRQCQDDFHVLRGLVKGKDWREYHVVDQYPAPVYRVADTSELLAEMKSEIAETGEFAVDTEFNAGKLWSVQISAKPGTAWFIPIPSDFKGKFDLTEYQQYATAIVHYYFADIPYLNMTENFIDTMTLAYLVGESQGLKELANRLCGINMITYKEMVSSGQQKLSLEYLLKASGMEWPDPPTIEETKWDNKKGGLVTKVKKPWHISRKINNILNDYGKDDSTDLQDRWNNIPSEEQEVVENVLGAMPESSLADIPFSDALSYSCRDSDATLRVFHSLNKTIADLELNYVQDMDLGILPMVYSMMQNGMAVDVDHFRNLSEDFGVRLQVKAAELSGLVGHPFNPNSSPQVAQVVYKELGFKPTKTTASGDVSTDDAELKKTGHPVAKGIIQYRGLLKLKSTYADNIIRSAAPDRNGVPRIHTTLTTTRVETGRLASRKNDDGTGANLQNIPTRNKESKAVKNGFIAPPGMRMAEADYSQVEMVTLAHLSNCKRLVELFNRGGDPHTEMAAEIFGLPKPKYEDGVADKASESKYRYPVKRLNFGIAYLIGGHGLATQIQEYISDLTMEGELVDIEPWDEPTCDKFIGEWYRLNPEVKDFQMEKAAEARRYGYVRDMWGRIRYIPEISCPVHGIQEAGARQAANFPVTACLPADTRVTTRNGWIPIGEFIDGTDVWTGERWAKANRLSMGVHPRVRLYLSDGRTFDCDVNHKLLVHSGVWPEWKNVMDITDTDTLSQDTATAWGIPFLDTEDWYWAGRFIGDGWLSGITAKIKFWGVSFGSKEVQDGGRLMRWLSTKGINGHTNSKTGYYPEYDARGNFKIAGGTQAGYALWQSLGMTQKKAKEKRIPSIVFTLDFDRRMAFFRGYSDADGTLRRSKRRGRDNSWSISSASLGLLEDTARLASTLGFTAHISKPKTRTYDWSSRKMKENRNNAPRHPTTSTLWYCSVSTYRRPLTVISKDVLDSEPMYTLSVDDDRHAFASEGLISKNSAQGIIKRAMVQLWQELPGTPWVNDAEWVMQIHDSLITYVTDDDDIAIPFFKWMLSVMTGVAKLRVPIKADLKAGYKWAELKKVRL